MWPPYIHKHSNREQSRYDIGRQPAQHTEADEVEEIRKFMLDSPARTMQTSSWLSHPPLRSLQGPSHFNITTPSASDLHLDHSLSHLRNPHQRPAVFVEVSEQLHPVLSEKLETSEFDPQSQLLEHRLSALQSARSPTLERHTTVHHSRTLEQQFDEIHAQQRRDYFESRKDAGSSNGKGHQQARSSEEFDPLSQLLVQLQNFQQPARTFSGTTLEHGTMAQGPVSALIGQERREYPQRESSRTAGRQDYSQLQREGQGGNLPLYMPQGQGQGGSLPLYMPQGQEGSLPVYLPQGLGGNLPLYMPQGQGGSLPVYLPQGQGGNFLLYMPQCQGGNLPLYIPQCQGGNLPKGLGAVSAMPWYSQGKGGISTMPGILPQGQGGISTMPRQDPNAGPERTFLYYEPGFMNDPYLLSHVYGQYSQFSSHDRPTSYVPTCRKRKYNRKEGERKSNKKEGKRKSNKKKPNTSTHPSPRCH